MRSLRTAPRDHQPPPTANGDQPPTTADRHQLPITNHRPPPTATNHQLPTTNRRQLPTANCHQPVGLFGKLCVTDTCFFLVRTALVGP